MQNVNDFFGNYAKALENYDTKGLAYLYNMPCTMLSDEATSVFNDWGKLEGFFNQGSVFYKQFGIAKVEYELWTRRTITDRIMNVKIIWQYFDSSRKPIYNCEYHYTLKLDKNDQWKIVLSIAVDEKARMEEWQVKLKSELVNRLAKAAG
jgi:hypothetical protein